MGITARDDPFRGVLVTCITDLFDKLRGHKWRCVRLVE